MNEFNTIFSSRSGNSDKGIRCHRKIGICLSTPVQEIENASRNKFSSTNFVRNTSGKAFLILSSRLSLKLFLKFSVGCQPLPTFENMNSKSEVQVFNSFFDQQGFFTWLSICCMMFKARSPTFAPTIAALMQALKIFSKHFWSIFPSLSAKASIIQPKICIAILHSSAIFRAVPFAYECYYLFFLNLKSFTKKKTKLRGSRSALGPSQVALSPLTRTALRLTAAALQAQPGRGSKYESRPRSTGRRWVRPPVMGHPRARTVVGSRLYPSRAAGWEKCFVNRRDCPDLQLQETEKH